MGIWSVQYKRRYVESIVAGCCIYILFLLKTTVGETMNPRTYLKKALLENYDPDVIPLLQKDESMAVFFEFYIGSIGNLDERNQVMTTYGWIQLGWFDKTLIWDPANFSGIESFVVPSKRIWVPELVLMNGVEDGKDYALDSYFRAQIRYNGYVLWIPNFRWATTCIVDLALFPLDVQICTVRFMSWLTPMEDQVSFSRADVGCQEGGVNDSVNVGMFTENEQWTLVDSRTSCFFGSLPSYHGHEINSSVVSFSLRLRRHPLYYSASIIFPCMTISLVSMFMFYLPVESGEKVSFGTTVLLSYTLLLLMINDITPKGGPNVPLLTYYIVFSMTLNASALICVFFILRVYNHSADREVPKWAKLVFLCECRAVKDVSPVSDGKERAEKKLKNQWRKLAKRLDNMFFFLFLTTYLLVTGAFYAYIANCTANGGPSANTICFHTPKDYKDITYPL